MAKNILVFADGTGNEGGLLPDESRTNVYKLYRATRTGPDSIIDPKKQLALYVPGIATVAQRHDNGWDRLKETVQQMFGFGITTKIIDCYMVIIGVWEPGPHLSVRLQPRGLHGQMSRTRAPTLRRSAERAEWQNPSALIRNRCDGSPRRRSLASTGSECRGAGQKLTSERSSSGPPTNRKLDAPLVLPPISSGYGMLSPRLGGSASSRRLGLFDQIWFAGNHADIGGSYPENESRLSDITLDWMVEFIIDKIPEAGCVIVDKSLLRLYPSADGMMHDECMVGMGGTALHWSKAVRDVPDTAQLHETVYERLAMSSVRNFTSFGPYRPAALQNHRKAKAFFEPTPTEKGPHAGESAQNETQTSGPTAT